VEVSFLKRLLSPTSVLKQVVGLLLLEVFWFSLMHPLVPSTLQGFLMEFAAGLCIMLIVYAAWKAIIWLTSQKSHVAVFKLLATTMALSVGILIFVAAYEFRSLLENNFHYFIFVYH
jgi:hypothetical protein